MVARSMQAAIMKDKNISLLETPQQSIARPICSQDEQKSGLKNSGGEHFLLGTRGQSLDRQDPEDRPDANVFNLLIVIEDSIAAFMPKSFLGKGS